MRTFRDRALGLRRDERGGVLVVMAFAIIAVSVMAGLSSIAITTGMTAMNQRASQSAQAGMRAAVGTVLAEVNSGGGAKAAIEDLEGRTFTNATGGPVKVSTTIESVRYDGSTVHLDVSIASAGRLEWTRKGTATLNLAYATSLARVVDGRAVWDYAAQSEKNDYAEQVVALWTAGEMAVYDPTSGTSKPVTPNQATIVKELSNGIATFTAAAAGGCQSGETVKLETHFRVGSGRWSEWSAATTASGELAAGQQATMEARTACVRGGVSSAWAVQSASILRAAAVPNSPTVYFSVDETGTATVTASSDARPTAGVTVTEQVRVRLGGGAWSAWSTSGSMTLTMKAGQTLEAQGRVRVLSATDDSGWIESGVATQTFNG
ncbi:MAG: hypothetical protein J0J04_08605 [Microbacterium sp.]|uniref:hypothetical protein n=1 Tax=Microbacterium sp. TaxID=51671 RepID=UPI001AD4A3B7|nr:hypothetical protein [Microbacterium sp.]MBN9214837.1 hypothetical protein [Microbacterium sp.]